MTHITQAEFAQIKFLVSKQKLPYTAIGSRVFSSPNYSVCGHCTPEEAVFIATACNSVWGLSQMVDELQARAESAERERDKLRAALDHAESHIQEMENAEGRAFFVDTAAMAKQLGSVTQERDALAERVKALEDGLQGAREQAATFNVGKDNRVCGLCGVVLAHHAFEIADNHTEDCAYITMRKLLENDHA